MISNIMAKQCDETPITDFSHVIKAHKSEPNKANPDTVIRHEF